mgnify:CR=1 FL=1|jgi:bifunctional DNase/RNase
MVTQRACYLTGLNPQNKKNSIMSEKEISRILMTVWGLSYSRMKSGAYILILAEATGDRRLPIIIGSSEAQAISFSLEKKTPPRPLTHDLMASMCHAFGLELKEVFISDCVEDVFYAELYFEHRGEQITLGSRTSDAVALALRVGAPIYTTESMLRKRGMVFEETEQRGRQQMRIKKIRDEETWEDASDEELQAALQKAVEHEEYEQASLIRDELKKRKEAKS